MTDPLYAAPRDHAILVDVPDALCLMIDGVGSPEASPEFRHAIQALYPLAYTLHFQRKKSERAYEGRVGPLEGLWWAPGHKDFAGLAERAWRWTLLIRLPAGTTRAMVERAREAARAKHASEALERVRVGTLREGRSAQILHVGAYSAEAPTIRKLEADIKALGMKPRGKHHEIYLGDPRRAKPEKLKTLIRRPVS